jgi:cation transport regulator ChaB
MPCDKLTDLPDSVKNNLSKHAQEIYRSAQLLSSVIRAVGR